MSGFPQLSLHAYYNNYVNDDVTDRLRRYFAFWNPVANLSDSNLAEKIHAEGIDILIDLTGHSAKNRLSVFARKPAPIQVSWIGYPGTTGLRAMDYYFADRFLLPPAFDSQFTEKIVRLPANAPFRPDPNAPPINALPALSNGFITFGSFNRPNKLSHKVISLWAKLLRMLPNSRIVLGGLLKESSQGTLAAWFNEEGIAASRIDFHQRSSMDQYLRLHHQVDICLDTYPYNGGTTTLHALWMGVPTLTMASNSMPGRVGTAIMSAVGLHGFVINTPEAFVAHGTQWASQLPALAELRASLRAQLINSPLLQPELLAHGLNTAFRTMWRRWCEELPLESFEVSLNPPSAPGTKHQPSIQ